MTSDERRDQRGFFGRLNQTDKGITCPKCGCRDMRVIYTKSRTGGRVVRQRGCRNCGTKINTTESVTATASDDVESPES